MHKVKSNSAVHMLVEKSDIDPTSRTTTGGTIPNVQVLKAGPFALIRCSAYTNAALEKGKTYSRNLGITPVLSSPTMTVDDGSAMVRVTEDGTLEFTPTQALAANKGINFLIPLIVNMGGGAAKTPFTAVAEHFARTQPLTLCEKGRRLCYVA